MRRFVGTSILVYAISTDPAEQVKRAAADAIFDDRALALSTQVLSEFYVQATRASRQSPLTHQQAVAIIASMTRYPIQPGTYAVVQAALATKARHSISYWDAAILEAARAAGCSEMLATVLTNEGGLTSGEDYDGVRVTNPLP